MEKSFFSKKWKVGEEIKLRNSILSGPITVVAAGGDFVVDTKKWN